MSQASHNADMNRRYRQIEEQASRWFALLQSGSCTRRDIAQHKAWLDADLMHHKAYRELEDLWRTAGDFADMPDVQALRQSALQAGGKRRRPAAWLAAGLAASLVIGIALLSFAPPGKDAQMVYRTAIGEQKTVTLPDGSTLILDTQTHVASDFTERRRLVHLHAGQAQFDVAKDTSRPFTVQAGNGQVTALGTVFVVRKDADKILVSLLEGQVQVVQDQPSSPSTDVPRPETTAKQSLKLDVGQQVAYSDRGISSAVAANVEQVTGWQSGRLVFDDATLQEVVDDLNRYSRSKILLGDDSLKEVRVTGVFKSGDSGKAIRALQAYFSMRVNRDKNGDLILLPDGMPKSG